MFTRLIKILASDLPLHIERGDIIIDPPVDNVIYKNLSKFYENKDFVNLANIDGSKEDVPISQVKLYDGENCEGTHLVNSLNKVDSLHVRFFDNRIIDEYGPKNKTEGASLSPNNNLEDI
jgi:hypothetical protein